MTISPQHQNHNIARSILARVQRARRSLAPWVRKRPAGRRTIARARRATVTSRPTRSLVDRVRRTVARAVVWRPDVGSIAPAMTARFSNSIVARFPSIGDKYRLRSPADDVEQTPAMVLSEMPAAAPPPVAAPFSGDERRSAPSSPRRSLSRWATPAGQKPAPARPPAVERSAPALPQNARLFSRVEEMPAASEQVGRGAEAPSPATEWVERGTEAPSPAAKGPVQRRAGSESPPPAVKGPVQRRVEQEETVQTAPSPSLAPGEPASMPTPAPPSQAPLQRPVSGEAAPSQTAPPPPAGDGPPLPVVSAPPTEVQRQVGAEQAPVKAQVQRQAGVEQAPAPTQQQVLDAPPRAVVSAPPTEVQPQVGVEKTPVQAAPQSTAEELPSRVVSAPPQDRVRRRAVERVPVQTAPSPVTSEPPRAGQMRLRVAPRQRLPLTRPSIAVVQRVTAHLEARGYRFKRKRQITPAPPSQVARAAAELERGAGAGSALAERPRAVMESALGQDFGAVRVHTAQLAPLGVQAASRGSDVYVGPGQDRFDTPDSLSLLGHELTHVSQRGGGLVSAMPAAQMTVLPVTQSPVGVAREEEEADSVEESIKRLLGSTALTPPDSEELPSGESEMELWESGGSEEEEEEEGSALEDAALSPDELAASPELFLRQEVALLVAAQQMASGGEYPLDLYQNLLELAPPDLEAAAEEGVISAEDVEAIEEMAALLTEIEAGQEREEPEEANLNLGLLARQVYPFVKQMLAVERERMAM